MPFVPDLIVIGMDFACCRIAGAGRHQSRAEHEYQKSVIHVDSED